MSTKSLEVKNKSFILDIFKGVVYSIAISLVLILLFAVLIRFLNIPDSFIMPTNQAIKIVSIFLGCFWALRGTDKGFLKGILIGLIYSILSYILFSILCGNFKFGFTTISDLIFSLVLGGICGILSVNIKSKKNK